MESYKALRVYGRDQASKSIVEDIALEKLSENKVLIEAYYSSINYKDALAVTSQGKILASFPMIPGIDVSGVVLEPGDSDLDKGAEVLVTGYGLGQDHNGGFAQYISVPPDWVVPLPDNLSLFNAMALGTAGFTAALAIQRMQDNQQAPDQGPIIVTGASGGVASIAINCLSQLGYEVVALSGKTTVERYLKELGASKVLNRHEQTMGDKVLEKGIWAGAIDTVGGDILAWLTRSTLKHGNIASCGLAAGIELHTTVMPFILRGINLLGIDSATCPMPIRSKVWHKLANEMFPACLDKIVTQTISLEEVNAVSKQMLAGQTQGRYVVKLR